ncbi:alpha/beta hydrolase [Bailinhaonella thermotolerans]|uniref:alpha/beta hydrolase n=1 Tax=Bailinhaonella thermotolerans TaxID=1070861 RepID=UPI00192A67F8|nr:alpha/beta hydrolase [Bailinhaonella thermotolerans]
MTIHVIAPGDRPARAAILLFHGGGWVQGSPEQFFPQCRAMAQRGILAASGVYRLVGGGADSPADCLADARAAISEFQGIAASHGLGEVAVGGGSAGGQLALAATLIDPVGPAPSRLVLFNPVVDLCCGFDAGLLALVGLTPRQAAALSPAHHAQSGLPPTLIFHGTADRLAPISAVRDLCTATGARLVEFEGAEHGFFNVSPYYEQTLDRMAAFLLGPGE